MSTNFTVWGGPYALFTTSAGTVRGQYYATSEPTDGGTSIWTETETPAAGYVAGGADTYTMVIGTQDWLGDVQPQITLAVDSNFVDPFDASRSGSTFPNLAAAVITSSTSTQGVGGEIYWTASATAGDYQLNFQPLTVTYPTATPGANLVTLNGSPTTMIGDVASPNSWTFSSDNSTSIVFAVTTLTSSTTETLWFYNFNGSGAPITGRTVIATGLARGTPYYIGYSSSGGYSYRYLTTTGANGAGLYGGGYNVTTGMVGTPSLQLALSAYTSFTGLSSFGISNGDAVRFVEGVANGANVIQTFLNSTTTAQATFTLGSSTDYFQTAHVLDPNDGQLDYMVLAYTDAGKVHLELLNQQGVQIGTDYTTNLTSFLRLHTLTGNSNSASTRVALDYSSPDTSGGQDIYAEIWDTATVADTYTLSGGSGLFDGTTLNDTISWAAGVYTIDGGGGTDTFSATGLAPSQIYIGFSPFPSSDIIFSDPSGDVDTLRRFSNIALSTETVQILGGELVFPGALPLAITGFGFSNSLDLKSYTYAGADHFVFVSTTGSIETFNLENASNAVLTSINFSGSFAGDNLVASADSSTGTLVSFYSAASRGEHFFNDTPSIEAGGLLWYNSTTGLVLDWRLVNGAISSSTTIAGYAPNSGWSVVGAADLTGNHVSDVLLNYTGGGQTVIGDWIVANGTYSAYHTIGGFGTGSGWAVVGTGDFNGDGVSDVLLSYTGGGNTVLYDWQVSNGQYAATNNLNMGYGTSSGWTVLGTGDFNGDGTSDVLFENTQSGLVADWSVNNNTSGAFKTVAGAAAGWSFDGIGDFNGDGTSDILWQNGSNLVIWQVSNGTEQTSINVTATAPTGYVFKGVSDYLGIGLSDILWQNPTNGQTLIWNMVGGTVASSVTPGGADPASWHIAPNPT